MKRHEFFATVDWDALLHKQIPPPFRPAVSRAEDAFYFDTEYTSKTPKLVLVLNRSESRKNIHYVKKSHKKNLSTFTVFNIKIVTHYPFRDSPGIPASANAHELFRGFSFVAPCLLEEDRTRNQQVNNSTEVSKPPLVNKPCAFSDEYELMGILGRGTFSVCRLCEHKATKKQYAVKVCIKKVYEII